MVGFHEMRSACVNAWLKAEVMLRQVSPGRTRVQRAQVGKAPGWVGPGGGTGVTWVGETVGSGEEVGGSGFGGWAVMGVCFGLLFSSGNGWTQYGFPMERRSQCVMVGF